MCRACTCPPSGQSSWHADSTCLLIGVPAAHTTCTSQAGSTERSQRGVPCTAGLHRPDSRCRRFCMGAAGSRCRRCQRARTKGLQVCVPHAAGNGDELLRELRQLLFQLAHLLLRRGHSPSPCCAYHQSPVMAGTVEACWVHHGSRWCSSLLGRPAAGPVARD